MINLIENLKQRGMLQDVMPGTEEQLQKEMTVGYSGFDPTASSLHIGNLATLMLSVHFQRAGHKPIVLVGGATGMIGDPSGKSEERKLLSEEVLRYNEKCIGEQMKKFLDFDCGENSAELVNNLDWFKGIGYIDFLRDVGKHLTVNYMTAKDSVKSRMETGISYTEFSYQLLQGYDFYRLFSDKNCKLQMGGSDQWGNLTSGSELIRRMSGGEAFAFTCPLVTKEDGTKFGKSEEGNVWLDPEMTSPYKFYQFWINCSDEEVTNLIRVFTLLSIEEIEALEKQHAEAPHLRILQKALAEEVTVRVHSEEVLETVLKTSEILFGKASEETLKSLDEKTLLSIFEGIPQINVIGSDIESAETYTDLLSSVSKNLVFPSKSEAVRTIKSGGVSINGAKILDPSQQPILNYIAESYLIIKRGKKNYFLIKAN